jgi:polyisoprenoid-binding protein YceI
MPGLPVSGEAAVMTTTTSVPETLSPGTYRIDAERCLITVRTRHLFGLGPVRGTFRLRSGEIRVAEQVQDSAVRATVDAESFRTGNPARDRTVRSARLLDTTGHPFFTFTSTEVTESGGRWVVRGRLVVRDAEQPVELSIEQARADGPQLTIVASAGIDRYAFGVTAMKGLAARRLSCQFEIVATRRDREAEGR